MISDETTPAAMQTARDLLTGKGNNHRVPPPLRGLDFDGSPRAVPPELIAGLILALVQALQACQSSPGLAWAYLVEDDFGRWDWLPWNRRKAKREAAVRRAIAENYKGNQDDNPLLYCELMGLVNAPDGRRALWLLWGEAKRTPTLTWIDKDAFMRP